MNKQIDDKLVVIAGNNPDEAKPLIKRMKEQYIDPGFNEFDFLELYGDDIEIEELSNTLLSIPMVSSRRIVVILKGFSITESQATDIRHTVDEMPECNTLIINYADEESTYSSNMREAARMFPDGKFIKTYRQDTVDEGFVRRSMNEKGIELSNDSIETIMHISNGDRIIADNLTKIAWMVNSNDVFRHIVDDKTTFDSAPFMHYDFLSSFFLKNTNRCFTFYRKLVKWNVLDEDRIVMMLLSNIKKTMTLKFNYERIDKESIDLTIPVKNKKSRKYSELKREKEIILSKWGMDDLEYAYCRIYDVLRKFRTIPRKFAILNFEETLIDILN